MHQQQNNAWDSSSWKIPEGCNDRHQNCPMAHYSETKDYRKRIPDSHNQIFSTNRASPLQCVETNNNQSSSYPNRKEKADMSHYSESREYKKRMGDLHHQLSSNYARKEKLDMRDEMNLESARIGPPLNEMKEDEGKVRYLYRKHYSSSPNFPGLSPSPPMKSTRAHMDRRNYEKTKTGSRYSPRPKERHSEDYRRRDYNQRKHHAPRRETPTPPLHQPRTAKSKLTDAPPKSQGLCTSCVLCKAVNNFANPCCLCEVPVCESCLKSNENITSWRTRINAFAAGNSKQHVNDRSTPERESSLSSHSSRPYHKHISSYQSSSDSLKKKMFRRSYKK